MPWRRLWMPLRLAVSGGLLVYLIWQAKPALIWEEWRQVSIMLLVGAIVIQFVGVAVSAAKWGMLLRIRGHMLSYWWLLGSYLAGQFANNFLPTSVGGDALRVAQLNRRIGSLSQASASVFLERLTGFLALSLIASAAIGISYFGGGDRIDTQPLWQWLTIGFGVVAICALVFSLMAPQLLRLFGPYLPGVIRRPLQRIAEALSDYAPRGGAFASVMGMSFLFQACWIGMNIACGWAVGLDFTHVPLLIYILMVTITDILGLAPFFFNNLGIREVVFTLYLAQVGGGQPEAVALALLVFSVRLLVSILGGLVILFGGADLNASSTPQTDAVSSKS
ncbi:MAG: lysylphosphatidylglycerol synthase transmembrane domain-containing protein [Chloroflexota bacterium]